MSEELSLWRRVFPYATIPLWRWLGGLLVFVAFASYAAHKERKRRAERAAVKHATSRAK